MNDLKYTILKRRLSFDGEFYSCIGPFNTIEDAKIKILEFCLNGSDRLKDFRIIRECEFEITDIDFDIYKKIKEAGE